MDFTLLCKCLGMCALQVLGDSQVIINWGNGEAQVKYLELHHWLENIKCLMRCFSFLSFNHVYRELNMEVDTLSKLELGNMVGRSPFQGLGLVVYIRYSLVYEDHILIVEYVVNLTQIFFNIKVYFLTGKKKSLLK